MIIVTSLRNQLLLLSMILIPVVSLAQQPADQFEDTADRSQPLSGRSDDKEWAREPREIVFQNDSQWEDNRWQRTDIGPFLGASFQVPGGTTLKGISISVGDKQQAAVCFDTARLRISAGWTGRFIKFEARRFGLIQKPAAAGKPFFTTPRVAGWAMGDRFEPTPEEITWPALEAEYTNPGASVVHLPKAWAAYKGLYTSGNRVVLSYIVGNVPILESPWFVETEREQAFVRSVEISPTDQPLQMWVAPPESSVALISDAASAGSANLRRDDNGPTRLLIAPHSETIRVKLLIARKETTEDSMQQLRGVAGNVDDLSDMIESDVPRWTEKIVTAGSTTETGGPYVIDTLTLPFDNPYNALFFTAGHDFFSDGSAAICTVHGDVWIVSGIDRQLTELSWRRYATGLFQPLGLRIVDDKVYVVGRDQITRLHDRNGDGEADFYENFNNDLFVSPRGHDFVTCLETDPEGNFYFIHGIAGIQRVSRDGSTMTRIADGMRNPNGMTVGPDGTITAAPQQGGWTPESSIIVVKQGGYYGFGGPRISKDRPTGWDLPMCFVPRSMDNSGGAQVWVEGDRWGPLTGQMLHLSYGQCRMLITLIEVVDGVYQGGTVQFPTTPADFDSGIMRGRFNPLDGQLYVSGLRGWQTRAVRDGCLQRIRYTGGPLRLPTAVKTYTNGIKLTFSEAIERDTAEDPENYFAEQWNYHWTGEYGSPDFSVEHPGQQGRDEVQVVSATLMDDGYSVFLEMPDRQPVNQLTIRWLLRSSEGVRFEGMYAHTINTPPTETIPESRLVRRERTSRIEEAVLQRLEPQLHYRFTSRRPVASDAPVTPNTTRIEDSRLSRLATLFQPVDQPPTPFLPAGPFNLDVLGTMRIPLSGYYDFKITGTGLAKLWVNDELLLDSPESVETSSSILLRKGHNRIRFHYVSPDNNLAELQFWWKGYNFNWEPVSPEVFYHDSHTDGLADALRRRLGRELFATHLCVNCHTTGVDRAEMFELSLDAPNLDAAGDRFTKDWLQEWLLTPGLLKPDAHMPSVLEDGASPMQDAADIATYLQAQRSATSPNRSPGDVSTSSLHDGESLYESLGCLSCHHFEPPQQADFFQRLSLFYANAKFKKGALTEFLLKPTAHYASTRMPDFNLSQDEANALAKFVRSESKGEIDADHVAGNGTKGKELFSSTGCANCHAIGATSPAKRELSFGSERGRGCLASSATDRNMNVPNFRFSDVDREAISSFIKHDLASLHRSDKLEASSRLVRRLQCANCHDRDGQRSHRPLVIAEEGSGRNPAMLPQLTRAGEKLQPQWVESLLEGTLNYRSRPWLADRMPAFPAYAQVLAQGLALEHGVDPQHNESLAIDPEKVKIGNELTLQSGLDCRQCHAIGDQQPRGDKDTKIAQGINFSHIRERLNRDAYLRFMFDPPRYDLSTNMIKLSDNGITTKVRAHYDADAQKQFDALWHYIQNLSVVE